MDIWNIMLGTLPVGGLAIGVAMLATSLLSKRIDDVNRRFDDINNRFDDVNRRIDETNNRFDDINRRIDDTSKRIDELRADVLARLDRIEQYFTASPKTQHR